MEQYNIGDDLKHSKTISYKPQLIGTSKEVYHLLDSYIVLWFYKFEACIFFDSE